MPFSSESPITRHGTLSVSVSPIVELIWVLVSALRDGSCLTQAAYAAIQTSGDLPERIRDFWGDGLDCFPELGILASHAGVLSEDAPTALAAVARSCRSIPPDLPLRTEGEVDAKVIRDRLARLRASAPFARRYLALVTEVWAAVEDEWQRVGRAVAESAVRRLSNELAGGLTWRDVLRRGGADQAVLNEWIQETDSWIATDQAVFVAPAYYSGHALLLDVPGLLIVGVRAAVPTDERRRFEDLARRLKSVADPTRLAILARAATGPVLVGELARDLGISQPTVSSHVKVLRGAGLLGEHRASGGRRGLVLEDDAVHALGDEMVRGILGAAAEK